jgi:hypothetical protein
MTSYAGSCAAKSSGDLACTKPITGGAGCWARVLTGHDTAAPPRSVRTSLRRMAAPRLRSAQATWGLVGDQGALRIAGSSRALLRLCYRVDPSPVVRGADVAALLSASMTVLPIPYRTSPSTMVMATIPATKGVPLPPVEALVSVRGCLIERRT